MMKKQYSKFVLLVCISVMVVFSSASMVYLKDSPLMESLPYEVSKVYPYITVTKQKLNTATTLKDLNPHYKPSWVRTYLTVEVIAHQNGTLKKVTNNSHQISAAQKNLMKNADVGTAVSIKINYIPENTLKENPARDMEFSFVVEPDNDAKYQGGTAALNTYLKQKVIDKIPNTLFTGYKLAAVKFTIDETGNIQQPELAQSSEDETIDALLLSAIRNMPKWKPASYNNGLAVKQEFALMVGNMESCVINTLNVNPRE